MRRGVLSGPAGPAEVGCGPARAYAVHARRAAWWREGMAPADAFKEIERGDRPASRFLVRCLGAEVVGYRNERVTSSGSGNSTAGRSRPSFATSPPASHGEDYRC